MPKLKPHIVALMPTFNRAEESPRLLSEAVASFLEQDYRGRATLLIGNDTPGQGLECNEPGVEVINYPERFPTLGHKIAAMVESARGIGAAALMRWDDDDYNLPHRLTLSAEHLADRLEWRPSNYWWHRRGLAGELWEVERPGNTHVMAIWRPSVLRMLDGYPLTTGDEDQEFNRRLHAAGLGPVGGTGNLPADQIFYVYRWGNSPRHLSGRGGSREQLDGQYKRIGEAEIATGTFEITPWRWTPPATRYELHERPDRVALQSANAARPE